jgi:hypothetical protein
VRFRSHIHLPEAQQFVTVYDLHLVKSHSEPITGSSHTVDEIISNLCDEIISNLCDEKEALIKKMKRFLT